MVEMVDCCSQKEIGFTHREFDNDFSKSESKVQRLAKAALPFLSLYQPAGRIIGTGASLARAANGVARCVSVYRHEGLGRKIVKPAFDLALSVAALAATILFRPVAMAITTSHDMAIGVQNIYHAAKKRDMAEVAYEAVRLASNAFYLLALSFGSIEVEVASLALLALSSATSSIRNFKKGRWIEAASDGLLAAVRIKQLIPKVEMLKLKWEIEAAIKNVFVGTLAGRWQFPSDHLPVGVEVNGTKIVSWNVMNTAYMSWVKEKDSQGLNGSMITDLDYAVQQDGLTARDERVVQLVGSIMSQSTDLIALQECGMPFLSRLERSLPSNWKLVKSFNADVPDQAVILYNSSKLAYLPESSVTTVDAYPSVPNRPLQNAAFSPLGTMEKVIRIFNAHIPGDPALPARDEFAEYVAASQNPNEVKVALGDNNFERHQMVDAYLKAGLSCFTLFSPWKTNIDPYSRESKAIDHIFVQGEKSARQLRPDEVLGVGSNLAETIAVLSR